MRAKNRETARAILELAHGCFQRGEIYQATDIYQHLLKRHPDTIEAQQGVQRIFEIAQHHEGSGRRHIALSLYEKVAAFRVAQEIADDARKSVEQVSDEGVRIQQRRRKRDGGDNETTAEIPFVDLTQAIDLKQNFCRLGEIEKKQAPDIASMVNSLKQSMYGRSPMRGKNDGQKRK